MTDPTSNILTGWTPPRERAAPAAGACRSTSACRSNWSSRAEPARGELRSLWSDEDALGLDGDAVVI